MLKIGFAKKDDISLISELEQKNFCGESYSYDTLLDIMKDNYILKNNDCIIAAYSNDTLIGYTIFHIQNEFTDIYKIYVIEEARNKKVGTELLHEIYKLAKKLSSKKIMIEVRSNNDVAINFYTKYGFNKIDIRKNYYKNPDDDAIIMERIIND